MSIAQDFTSELDYELPATRRLLERVPTEKGPWKPHPKSSALGHLAQLVTRLPGVMADIVRGIDLDLAAGPPYTFEPTETLLREFDAHVNVARDVLRAAKDDDFALTWSLRYADRYWTQEVEGTSCGIRSIISSITAASLPSISG